MEEYPVSVPSRRNTRKPFCYRMYPSHISVLCVLSGNNAPVIRQTWWRVIVNRKKENSLILQKIYLSVIPHFLPSIHLLELTPVFICLYSGVWCVTQRGKSTSPSFLCWWDPSLDTWCLESLLTGKIFDIVLAQHKILFTGV